MGDDSHVFYVTPAVMEIPPLKTIDFRIHFSPVSLRLNQDTCKLVMIIYIYIGC